LFSNLNYNCQLGHDIERDYTNPLYHPQLEISLNNINKGKNQEAINAAIEKLKNIDFGSIEERNSTFTEYLQNGIAVNYLENNEEKTELVKLIDYENTNNNDFTVINQWTVKDKAVKRPDVVVFVNGIPLVVIELKSPSNENTDA
jgi:type I restriction enzyme R subunit